MKKIEIFLSFISLYFLICAGYEIEDCPIVYAPLQKSKEKALVIYNFTETYTIIELEPESGGKCLDGSNYKFLITRGQGDGIDKFMFYFEGAAFCQKKLESSIWEEYYSKLSTKEGSSNSSYWGDNGTNTTSSRGYGWFSSMKEYNPYFWNYNKIYLISCDGSFYQGSLDEPIIYKGSKIWIRGLNNTLATIKYLEQHYGLLNASEVIIGGESSGGTAAIVWSSYLQDYFPKSTRVIGLCDGGFLIDTYNLYSGCHVFRYFIQNIAVSIELNSSNSSVLYRKCKYRDTDLWKCMIPEYIVEDIDIPMFFFNSQHDYQQVTNLNGLQCIMNGGLTYCNKTDRAIIDYVREYFLSVAMRMKKIKPHWGFWSRTCFEHTYHFTWSWYGFEMNVFSAETQKSSNGKDAFYSWYDSLENQKNSVVSYFDVIDWLHNPLCHYGNNQYNETS